MEDGKKSFMEDFVGKVVLIKTHWGLGTQDASLKAGEYKGLLLGYDGSFLKLEYDVRTFISGANVVTKDILLINRSYVLSVGEYRSKGD